MGIDLRLEEDAGTPIPSTSFVHQVDEWQHLALILNLFIQFPRNNDYDSFN